MKKIFFISAAFLIVCINSACAQVLKGNISILDEAPSGLFGSWRVEAQCISSTDAAFLGSASIDIWTLERNGDTVILSNPVSGASAAVNVNEVSGNTVKFEKRSFLPDEESIETPVLTLHGVNFTGTDIINIKTFKNGKLIREDYVKYRIKGAKISGASADGIFRSKQGVY